ncbi:MAG: DNA polymerase III subunit delta [Ignavibacteria bacterium]|jgi:DNA polymerase-3 subunit delta|nr:DNA polymerase III subunit delta [Ignavibacteria bacterium]
MAKTAKEAAGYQTTFDKFLKETEMQVPNILLLFLSEKILFDEFIELLTSKFIGDTLDKENHIRTYFSDSVTTEEVINECSNFSFLSDRKIIVYRLVKKSGVRGISKEAREAFLSYARNPNPDTVLTVHVPDREYNFANFTDFETQGIKISAIKTDDLQTLSAWIKGRFRGFSIDDESITHLLQFVNPSYDEVSSEIEKLKTYCTGRKEITIDDINLCVGMTKDFNENNLFEAILNRNFEKAIGIYNNMSSKTAASSSEVELRFIGYMNNLFIAMHKLRDAGMYGRSHDFRLFSELKLWKDGYRMIKIYKDYLSGLNELKIKKAFDYIYLSDRALKHTQQDKQLVISNLIHNLINL